MTTAAKAVTLGKPLKGYVLKVQWGVLNRYDYPDGSTLMFNPVTKTIFELK